MREQLELILRRSFDGGAWHGPSLAEALAEVDARTALARPIPGAHSIWELTHHLMAWTREVTRRLLGGDTALPVEGNWRAPAADADDAAWTRLRASLDAARDALLETLGTLPAARLDEPVRSLDNEGGPGESVSVAQMVIGLAEHNAYHGGQIALLKRALAPAAPPRDPAAITES